MDLAQFPTTPVHGKKYDVFISFRGEDTRKNFTSHLHTSLLRQKVETYIDDRLVRGDEISQALLDAIEDSQLSVIIFSENYASSSWCLDELLHILYCREKNKQIVLPVFYHVNPSDVRKQQGSYADAFAKHEERFKENITRKWRTALTTAANLSGWDASIARNDSELVGSIVNDIMAKLNYTPLDNLKGLVGIDSCIEDVKSLLSHAPIVGIWGMGGLGKTTLANAVFKQSHIHFEGHCFLANVRVEMERHGATYLQKNFFGELSKEKYLDLANLQSVKQRLCRKKLLIVLDDVDDFEQYEHLVEDRDWLNSESRVIITSRDQQVLRNIIGVKEIYKLKELNENEALQLFWLHAFKRNFATENDIEMSRKFVNYAQGIPLALKVLGSHLHSKSKEEWESALNKLKVVPNKKILDILKISFYGLDNKEKEIFLDIACFFQGMRKDFVKRILDDGGCFMDVIRVLVDKALITVSDNNELRMHDLLQEMAWEIARGQYCKEFGKQSRLWINEDICHVLKYNTGTARIEGIILNDAIGKDTYLEPFIFTKMKTLRLLQIVDDQCRFHFPQGLHSFPDELRYLRWDHYPLESLGLHFTPRNLVNIDMRYSQLEKLWNEFQHGLENLKYVELSFSEKLTCLPDLSRANLKRLGLQGCTSLLELPPLRFQNVLDKITEEEKMEIDEFDHWIHAICDQSSFATYDIYLLPSIWIEETDNYNLDLRGCSNLKTLSEMSGNIRYISLESTAIEELHSSIGSLNNLVLLDLKDCQYLKNLPSSICDLDSLKYLDMCGCISIDKFPELPKNIRGLDLSETSIEQVLSSSFECLPCLEILYMNFTGLESLPTSICKLKSLMRLSLLDCSQLKSFPEILEPMENLEELDLTGTGIKEIPSSIESLVGLKSLYLSKCRNLEYVPINIHHMCNLHHLEVLECPKLQGFPYDSLSSLPVLDPSGITIGKLPFCIIQTVQGTVPECTGSCARNSLVFFLKCLDELEYCIHLKRCRHYWYKFWMRFTYCECLIFYTVHNILMTQYFNNKVLRVTTYVLEHGKQESGDPGMSFCYSGNKIPQWFTYQSMGPSVHVNFSPLRHNTSFIGFALCIIVDFDQRFSDPEYLDLGFKYHFKPSYLSRKYDWTLQTPHNAHSDSNLENNILDWSSDHVFVWHLYEDDYYYRNATGCFFEFNLGQSSASSKHEVKQCGIRMLFRQEAKELDFIEHVLGGNINSETNETHPKRIIFELSL
ncbi:TIR-NBS-LRR-like protein [Trema orientale]|uniref:ADP-ribosyl cyclase/cyclic ADP-ribose hydrolase n=1 Tax=Trema orientale TaxID=63057 RepID=A0A2P5FJD0_TREOI|nr:TIR-NBS-LRR-like protein [Trema orientale]